MPASTPVTSLSGDSLADILERVLDKGIVIAGDIQINLLDIELLTIKLRLVVASVDKAKEMGIDWWERDPTLSSGARELEDENKRLRERVEALERRGLPGGDEDEAELADEDAQVADEVDDADEDLDAEDDADELDADELDAPEDDAPADSAPASNGRQRSSSTRRRPARRSEGQR
jgi:hypothetical protein